MYPNPKNFCGGNFSDWLEVMLTEKCNGKCSWCIEKNGYRPTFHASWECIADRAIQSGKSNIIFLGGEPTLYGDLKHIVRRLNDYGLNVYVTTNGSMLSPVYVHENLVEIAGINISIHDSSLQENICITGINLDLWNLQDTIAVLHEHGVIVRLNCNLIKGHVDSKTSILSYIEFAKGLGTNSIRFAELKDDEDNFVDLYSIFGDKYGINNEPFGLGCNTDVVINEMPVNFRQMCGLQTPVRVTPIDPQQVVKKVLYYDGKFYNGWQKAKENADMTEKEILDLLLRVSEGEVPIIQAAQKIMAAVTVLNINEPAAENIAEKTVVPTKREGAGCQY